LNELYNCRLVFVHIIDERAQAHLDLTDYFSQVRDCSHTVPHGEGSITLSSRLESLVESFLKDTERTEIHHALYDLWLYAADYVSVLQQDVMRALYGHDGSGDACDQFITGFNGLRR